MKEKCFKFKKDSGFTLIELIVVLAVFFVITASAVDIFISSVNQQKKAQIEQDLLNQVTYIIEYISRQTRTALADRGDCLGYPNLNEDYYYALSRYDPEISFFRGIKFLSNDGSCYEIFFDTDGTIKRIKDNGLDESILSKVFEVKYLRFVINGDKSIYLGKNYPRLTLSLSVKIKDEAGYYKDNIFQTTVSRRVYGRRGSEMPADFP